MQLPFKRVKTEFTLDMLNLINLFNSDKGLFEYMSFGQLSTLCAGVVGGQHDGHGDAAARRLQPVDDHGADVPQVPARRSPLALADAARRTYPLLVIARAFNARVP